MPNEFHSELPDNVDITVTGDEMVIKVNLSKTCGRSASGKTMKVGSTNGFFQVPTHPGVVLSLNVNKK